MGEQFFLITVNFFFKSVIVSVGNKTEIQMDYLMTKLKLINNTFEGMSKYENSKQFFKLFLAARLSC